MDAHHASLGRRRLEEIRQKRAAERLHKASSGSDLESSDPYGTWRSEGGNRAAETDSYALVKELENKNAELERENRKLLSKLEEMEVENDSLTKRINDLEQNTLPSLRKSLKNVFIEKDAAVVAREDALSQLRTMKKRLKEAEEEQYRAEEDAASLRAELNSLQQQGMGNSFSSIPLSDSTEQILVMEKEIMELKTELQQESLLRQLEQQKLAEEQLRTSSLMSEKQELEDRLAVLTKKISDSSDLAARKGLSVKDKEKLEKQLHDMAIMVERLENSRQKLLMEIDSQSSELERLFEENFNLSASYQDALGLAGQWESQVKDCLKQNEELRHQLDKLRTEQINPLQATDNTAQSYMETERGTIPDPSESGAENLLLKVSSWSSLENNPDSYLYHGMPEFSKWKIQDQLVKEKGRAEALAAEVMKLTAELRRAVQAHNNLTRLYRPVLRNIENNLMKMKQETFA